ncbi:MAG: HD domain-containing protein [Abditibacteriota bacterium]|nr:HD domain-containing protein [Abditibacteriota bacterium]
MKDISLLLERQEAERLSEMAALSADWKDSRQKPEPPCPVRTVFMRDRDRIIHCRTFRRMADKTQVFVAREDIHFRTRLTHTLEVFQISTVIASALRLNEDLTAAIAMGHDLGHTPFGHAGESALAEILSEYGLSFHHARQSLRVVDVLEKLNLTEPVRDGILKHSKGACDLTGSEGDAVTAEGRLVRICDRIAYINHDIDDSFRAGIICPEDLKTLDAEIPVNTSDRIALMSEDMIQTGLTEGRIGMSPKVSRQIDNLKDFMYRAVYFEAGKLGNEAVLKEELKSLFRFYMKHPEHINPTGSYPDDPSLPVRAADYISNMTDTYANEQIKRFVL